MSCHVILDVRSLRISYHTEYHKFQEISHVTFCHMSCNVWYIILHILLYNSSSLVKCQVTSDAMSCHVKYQVKCSILNVNSYKVISYPAWMLQLHNGLEGPFVFFIKVKYYPGLMSQTCLFFILDYAIIIDHILGK